MFTVKMNVVGRGGRRGEEERVGGQDVRSREGDEMEREEMQKTEGRGGEKGDKERGGRKESERKGRDQMGEVGGR